MAQVRYIPTFAHPPFILTTTSRQHNNTNPVTQEPLQPSDLITLHYSRKPNGEIHDPISFKPFSEHSHIVAITTTGNVFLAESIKGGRDLVADVRFKKYVIFIILNFDLDIHFLAEKTW
jgi:peptidyl-prolyl cis-trans isomerase-like 2